MALAQTWDAALDFDKDDNPSGVWGYGYRVEDTGSFSLMTVKQNFGLDYWRLGDSKPDIGHNGSGVDEGFVPAGALIMHPGIDGLPGYQALVRWTAPADGDYGINALFTGIDPRDPHVAVRVALNGVNVYGDALEGTGTQRLYNPSLLNLKAGETVDFGVANLGDFVGDRNWIRLDATIQAVPEPVSLVALGLGAAVFCRKRRSTADSRPRTARS